MEQVDTIIVGGGPAGSSCAWRLVQAGADVLILDRAVFPRPKLCAGWITPQVVQDLELEGRYPHGLLTFDALQIHLPWLSFPLPTRQHSIRRIEFDAWLLERSGARVATHNVRDITRDGDGYVIDGKFRCRTLVGAGGTRCPVYRALFRPVTPRKETKQIVVLEEEFRYDWQGDPRCHLWFFDDGLPGYSWYVPKGGGWLNVGVGGIASEIQEKGKDIRHFWRRLTADLESRGLVKGHAFDPGGYTYYLQPKQPAALLENAWLIGDAAGLATTDLGEGIGPAIESGLRTADAILGRGIYDGIGLTKRSLPGLLRESRFLGWAAGFMKGERTVAVRPATA
ncbi:MAG: NAD(P)/FAD-dependent oxidoreductase [Geminicoccaceae bacterium]